VIFTPSQNRRHSEERLPRRRISSMLPHQDRHDEAASEPTGPQPHAHPYLAVIQRSAVRDEGSLFDFKLEEN
jgi:hypothetical protein